MTSLGRLLLSAGLLLHNAATAATLKPEAIPAWDSYINQADVRMKEHLKPGHRFLASDEGSESLRRIRDGEPLVRPAGGGTPRKVPAGLIHDWIGISFAPGATIQEVVSVLRDYEGYAEFYKPAVVASRLNTEREAEDRFYLLLANKTVSKSALEGEYQVLYVRVDDHRWYSRTEANEIREIAKYGSSQQHILASDEGSGLMWRLVTYIRLQEEDGGVYIETESIVLSRDIPIAVNWILIPIINRVVKGAMTLSLKQTAVAVRHRRVASELAHR